MHRFNNGFPREISLHYCLFQCDTSVVVIIVLCFGVELLCCLKLVYDFIFLV